MKLSPPPEESKFLDDLRINSDKYFKAQYPNSNSLVGTRWATFPDGERIYFLTKFYWDFKNGIKVRVIAIDNLGRDEKSTNVIASYNFQKNDKMSIYIKNQVDTANMPVSPKLFIYTNKLVGSADKIREIFKIHQPDTFIEIIDESMLSKTLFISYGGPDEEIATKINNALKSKGVKTWFFPEDALPGEKLHRVMSNGISNYDYTLLLCSESSLNRNGLLNELERVFEREAKEGGSEILIPIAIDDYVFNRWQPERKDIKEQVLSRVIGNISDDSFSKTIDKILKTLRK